MIKWISNYNWLQTTRSRWQLKSSVQNFSVSSCLLFLWSYVVIGIHNLMHLSSSISNELFVPLSFLVATDTRPDDITFALFISTFYIFNGNIEFMLRRKRPQVANETVDDEAI